MDQVVGEGDVDWGEAFQLIGGAKGEAEPESFGARTGEEGAAGEALGVGAVAEIEVADVADVLNVVEEEGKNPTFKVQELQAAVTHKSGQRKVAGEDFSREAPDDDFFVGRRHGWRRIRGIVACAECKEGKTCNLRSQIGNAVLN